MLSWSKCWSSVGGSDQLYMSSDSLGHGRRDSKVAKDIAVSRESLASFPRRRRGMRLYYNTEEKRFVYAEKGAKYVVDPNYKIKISRKKVMTVAFITAQKVDGHEFKMRKYIRVK